MKDSLTRNLIILILLFIVTALGSILLYAQFKSTGLNNWLIASKLCMTIGACIFFARGMGFAFLITAYKEHQAIGKSLSNQKEQEHVDSR